MSDVAVHGLDENAGPVELVEVMMITSCSRSSFS